MAPISRRSPALAAQNARPGRCIAVLGRCGSRRDSHRGDASNRAAADGRVRVAAAVSRHRPRKLTRASQQLVVCAGPRRGHAHRQAVRGHAAARCRLDVPCASREVRFASLLATHLPAIRSPPVSTGTAPIIHHRVGRARVCRCGGGALPGTACWPICASNGDGTDGEQQQQCRLGLRVGTTGQQRARPRSRALRRHPMTQ